MKTWILGTVATTLAVASMVACVNVNSGGNRCDGVEVDGVCMPAGTGASGTGSTSMGNGGHTSSTSSTGTTPGSSSSSGATGGSPSSSSSSSSSGGGTCDAPESPFDCASVCPDVTQCDNCVLTSDQTGNAAWTGIILQDCACVPGGTCYQLCENEPACTGQVGDTSTTCTGCVFGLPTTDACYPQFVSDCDANPDCTTFLQEIEPCGNLPP